MNNMLNTLNYIIQASRANLALGLGCVAILWSIYLINGLLGKRLLVLGIIPREPVGLIGIICAPFLHADLQHLFFNSIPLFILADLLLIYGQPVFIHLTILLILLSGAFIWLFARKRIHIGASAVIMGYWSFLLVNAYLTKSTMAWLLAAFCLYYLAGLALNLLPTDARASWEGHIFGALAGILAVWMM